jgi:hypothetical protein
MPGKEWELLQLTEIWFMLHRMGKQNYNCAELSNGTIQNIILFVNCEFVDIIDSVYVLLTFHKTMKPVYVAKQKNSNSCLP